VRLGLPGRRLSLHGGQHTCTLSSRPRARPSLSTESLQQADATNGRQQARERADERRGGGAGVGGGGSSDERRGSGGGARCIGGGGGG